MTVSKREFFDMAYWKQKRYNAVIYQAGKNPADFEVVEAQDMANFELQQAFNTIVHHGCIADAFNVVPLLVPGNNTVRIYQGRAYAQSFLAGAEFSGIRLDLPDVLTTFPSLTYEHAVDINGYYEYDFTAEQSLIPPAGSYRYDLIYIEFWRKEYEPSDDSEMQDPVLGETARREKWYYEFHFYQGDNINKNPSVPSLTAGHQGMRLAIIKRMNTEIVDEESIIDVRPKLSPSINFIGNNFVTVGPTGGNYETLYDVICSRTETNAITPTAVNPYTVFLQPGIYTCPFQFNLGTLGYINIVGSGVDKTILEFEDLYSLAYSVWINIGASPSVVFSDMTIRFIDSYTADAMLIGITDGKVEFRNCKLGGVSTGMLFGGIDIDGGTLIIKNCEIETRATDKRAIHMSGDASVEIYYSVIRQSKYQSIANETLTTGSLKIWDSSIVGNDEVLFLNGYSELYDCIISKEAWFAGDALEAGQTMTIQAESKLFSCKMLGTPGNNVIEIETDAEMHDCIHDGVLLNSSAGIVKFFNCSLTNVEVSNSATPEFYGCEFMTSSSVSLTFDTVPSASIISCDFKRDGLCFTGTDTIFDMVGCKLGTTGANNVIELSGTSVPRIQGCDFVINNAGAVGIKLVANTATPVVTHCTFIGNASALMFDAASATTMKAGHISGDTTLKGANVTITNIEKTL